MKRINNSIRFTLLVSFVLLVPWQAIAQGTSVSVGHSRFSEQHRVEYIIGGLPVIISAPHGGRLAPKSIPNRTYGTLLTDTNTDLLAREIAQAFYKQTGGYPHVIICHLKRTKVDCNRDITEGAQGNPEAGRVWRSFHGFINDARCAVALTSERGLYIDLHGHAHPEALLELGYLLGNRHLKQEDKELTALQNRSSIRNLAVHSEASFLELLRGDSSFGGLMQQRGYPSVPSPAHPHAGNGKFFSGGANTRRHAGRDDGLISGFQIECPKKGIRDTEANRKAFADAFADAVTEYFKVHYKVNIGTDNLDKQEDASITNP